MSTPYSIKTLAERWGCCERTIRNMIAAGRLPIYRVGGRLVRISAGAVDAWENGGGNTESVPTVSASSTGKPAQSGKTRRAATAEDLASRLPR